MIGIYKLINNINGKMYIGQSINIEKRIKQHLVYQPNFNTSIGNAIKKYGADNFSFEILEQCSINELDEKEQFWIKYYNTYEKGYNETRGGQTKNHYLNYEQIEMVYKQTGSIKQTAKIVGCNERSVSAALKMLEIDTKKVKENLKSTKEILQLDLDGNYVKKYDSQKQILQILNCSRQSLSKALNNGTILKGFYWQYSNKQHSIDNSIKKNSISRYDIQTGALLKTYSSYADALKDIDIEINTKNKNLLSKIKCGYRKNNVAFGFLWQ